jgi:hypothetical protein
MEIGLLAYWWTGIGGTFTEQPITVTGIDRPFLVACSVFTLSLFTVLAAISKLRGRQVQIVSETLPTRRPTAP